MKAVTQKKKRSSKLKRLFKRPTYFAVIIGVPGFFRLELIFGKKPQ